MAAGGRGLRVARVVEKEMGLTRAEFLRVLPRVLDGADFVAAGQRITVEGMGLTIILMEAPPRRIGSVALPVMRVRLELDRWVEADADVFLARFDRHFQRGGG